MRTNFVNDGSLPHRPKSRNPITSYSIGTELLAVAIKDTSTSTQDDVISATSLCNPQTYTAIQVDTKQIYTCFTTSTKGIEQ